MHAMHWFGNHKSITHHRLGKVWGRVRVSQGRFGFRPTPCHPWFSIRCQTNCYTCKHLRAENEYMASGRWSCIYPKDEISNETKISHGWVATSGDLRSTTESAATSWNAPATMLKHWFRSNNDDSLESHEVFFLVFISAFSSMPLRLQPTANYMVKQKRVVYTVR